MNTGVMSIAVFVGLGFILGHFVIPPKSKPGTSDSDEGDGSFCETKVDNIRHEVHDWLEGNTNLSEDEIAETVLAITTT